MSKFLLLSVAAYIILSASPKAEAQATRQVKNTTLYIKSCEPVNAQYELCILCADKALKSQCALYITDKNSTQPTPTALTKAQAIEVLSGKDPVVIGGLKKGMQNNETYFFVQSGAVQTRLYPSGSSYMMVTFGTGGTAENNFPGTIVARELSPIEVINLSGCLMNALQAHKDCERNIPGGLSEGDHDAREKQCLDDFVSRGNQCNKDANARIINVVKVGAGLLDGIPNTKK